jgi:hypothetical protein
MAYVMLCYAMLDIPLLYATKDVNWFEYDCIDGNRLHCNALSLFLLFFFLFFFFSPNIMPCDVIFILM